MQSTSNDETAHEARDEASAAEVAAHVRALLVNPRPPDLTRELANVEHVREIHDYIVEFRTLLGGFARGDFSREVKLRGSLAGMVKSLQANLQHLSWQMVQIEKGDFTQRVDYMGEFSEVFNRMVTRLDDALTTLQLKEEELVHMANDLKVEVEKRGAALAALQKSQENFKYLAEHDPLTGLLNRRSFFAKAGMELARGNIMDNYSCVALMDVDHFKVLNDTYGHLNGDEALRHIARLGQKSLRDGDIIGRYGGEEFIFFFSKATPDQGLHAADRIRKLIADTPVLFGDKQVKITASFGVVPIPPEYAATTGVDIMETAVFLADTALYRAKSEGRNRVCAEDFQLTPPEGSSCRLVKD